MSSPGVIYYPASYFEPLQLAELWGQTGPIEVELGSGDGGFLVQYATAHPERNLLGVERLLGRLRKIERKAQRGGLKNVRVMRIEAGYFLQFLLPPESIRALHIYFPDPWPKRKHWKNRLINAGFPKLAARVLEREGTVYLRTDDADYFAQMQAVFGGAVELFRPVETPAELGRVLTDFEREFQARGIPTRAAAYRRSSAG